MLPEDDTSELEQQAGIIVRIDSTEDLVETPVMNTQAEDDEAEPEPERFNDAADAPDDQSITRITDITIRHCGTVFGIQVSYVLSDGRVFAPSHGNPTITHNEDRVILSEMESIVAVQGTASSGIIWQLAFVIRDLKDHTERVCDGPFLQVLSAIM
ncbi:hypothetical protein BD410DRAFT_547761 [Rickenella mellea]|uniref:Jacalin-type lectin domain-containing protein n=1 Tax=Rickenella mellea TaxID=50990 RepID=A0A4Y7PSG0_9AGAM|nr:hypothetical protein BD410DRAFT_547761 [Rickenella mellea]